MCLKVKKYPLKSRHPTSLTKDEKWVFEPLFESMQRCKVEVLLRLRENEGKINKFKASNLAKKLKEA